MPLNSGTPMLAARTFYGCTSLTSVALPDTVTTIGEDAFHACTSCNSVVYSGGNTQAVQQAISQQAADTDEGEPVRIVEDSADSESGEPGRYSGGSVSQNEDGSITIQETTVSMGENAFIRKSDEIVLMVENPDDPAGTDTPGGTTVDSPDGGNTLPAYDSAGASIEILSGKTTISAVVENSDGWTELAETVAGTASEAVDVSVEADVRINTSALDGDDLGKLAGQNATVEITTDQGDTWRIDTSAIVKDEVTGKTYDLGYTVSPDKNKKIDSDEIYKVEFDGNIDFKATVCVNVNKSNANQYATLYEKKGGRLNEKETVIVDNNGDAWFTVESVSKRTDYYVGINVEGVNTAEATIPHTMYEEYNIDPEYTLTDASGTQYAIGARTSRWGITGGQFALYVAIGIGALVLIVTLLMITLNKMKQSKLKYASMANEDKARKAARDEIDEDELRLKVMQELLGETRHEDE